MKQYPYLSECIIITTAPCDYCQKQCKKLLKLEWQEGWSRGDDEYEKICADCLDKSQKKRYQQIPERKIIKLKEI